jgi:RNA polymerase sigma-70 factor, ECF subfamily
MVARDQVEKSAGRVRLMERAQGGDREAFHSLFAEIGPIITLFVRRRVFDQTEVEDVCQEALIAIFKSRHTYQSSRPFEPWLFAIVRNVIGAYLERNRRHNRWQEPASKLTEAWAEDESTLALELRDGLNQLSADQLEALKLTKLSGFSIADAASSAGTSVGSMKVRVHRAYVSLKRSMQR